MTQTGDKNSLLTSDAEADSAMRNFISREEVRRFRHLNTLRMCMDFGLVWLQAALGVTLFAILRDVPSLMAGALLVGTAQHGFSLIAHEGVHGLIVPNNRRMNDGIANLLFAAPILLPFAFYRQRHFTHHRLVSTPEDTKEQYRRELVGWRLPFEIVRSLSGLDFIGQVVSVLRRHRKHRSGALQAETEPAAPRKLLRDGLTICAVQLVLLAGFGVLDYLLYPLIWLLPNVTVAVLCAKIRSEVEHHPAPRESAPENPSPYFKGTAKPFIRSVRAGWIERIFISKINFHYHGEHHRWPGMSYQYLPEIHTRLRQQKYFNAAGIRTERNYLFALYRLWSGR